FATDDRTLKFLEGADKTIKKYTPSLVKKGFNSFGAELKRIGRGPHAPLSSTAQAAMAANQDVFGDWSGMESQAPQGGWRWSPQMTQYNQGIHGTPNTQGYDQDLSIYGY
ncbi:MAG: hypothetical protein DRQ40_10005, partial [Gammaproteobacteria bacterium]